MSSHRRREVCMLADIRIRRETDNHYVLRDALRAIVAGGANIETAQQLADVLAVGDRAVRVPVRQQPYNEMKATPASRTLDSYGKSLIVYSAAAGERSRQAKTVLGLT